MKYQHYYLQTEWSDSFDRNNPLPDYPRPQLRRNSFLSLNGVWECDFSFENEPLSSLKRTIIVPYSPESALSEVDELLPKNQYLHYRKEFEIPCGFILDKVILNVGAVDQTAKIYVNDELVAEHTLPYIPISVLINDYLKEGKNVIYIICKDNASSYIYARGKQRYENKGVFHTPISGIWQSIWLESVPNNYIKNIKITPDIDKKIVDFEIDYTSPFKNGQIEIYKDGVLFDRIIITNRRVTYHMKDFNLWSPEHPHIYDAKISIGRDTIYTYFAMRKFSSIRIGNMSYFGLNSQPYFLVGIIDQGYYPEGIYTPTSFAEVMFDIKTMKKMGFNLVRKLAKIEPLLYYSYCDRLGLIVFQDFVPGGDEYSELILAMQKRVNDYIDDTTHKNLGRNEKKSREEYQREVVETINLLYNSPSIAAYTLFSEGWGQFDSKKMTDFTRSLDATRLIISASGWYDTLSGDIYSRHASKNVKNIQTEYGRIFAFGSLGEYSHYIEGHTYNKKPFAVKNRSLLDIEDDFIHLLSDLKPLVKTDGLNIVILNQYVDVEEELTGLLTYDRKITKVNADRLIKIFGELGQIFYESNANKY